MDYNNVFAAGFSAGGIMAWEMMRGREFDVGSSPTQTFRLRGVVPMGGLPHLVRPAGVFRCICFLYLTPSGEITVFI